MIYFVEGLNCSGKTTWIKNQENMVRGIGQHVVTDWLNPLRWSCFKKFSFLDEVNSYLIGSYETAIRIMVMNVYYHYYVDRTFVSALAYKSLLLRGFTYIIEEVLKDYKDQLQFILVDTAPELCYERWCKLKEANTNYKKYVKADTREDFLRLYDDFHSIFTAIEHLGYITRYI